MEFLGVPLKFGVAKVGGGMSWNGDKEIFTVLLGRFIPKVGKGAKADIVIFLFLFFSHKII